MKQAYKHISMRRDSLIMVSHINTIIARYQQAGHVMSVRQLYYQLVASNLISNTEQSYKRIASLVNDGRLGGLIDWDALEDRNRDVVMKSRWRSGGAILQAVARQFHMDQWVGQETRMFVVIEKAALAGVIEPVCDEFDVPYLAARGYPSVSIVREFVLQHMVPAIRDQNQHVHVLHLGDHDPSGLDMSRDLEERIRLFARGASPDITVERVALNMDQIEEQNPPPNPAKSSDSRFNNYAEEHGDSSWELDALPPDYIDGLVRDKVSSAIDDDAWVARDTEIQDIKARLQKVADEFDNQEL